MAKSTLLTNNAKVTNALLTYYAPTTVIPPNYNVPVTTSYFALSKCDPWVDDNNPPTPAQDIKSQKQFFKNIFLTKYVDVNDISPVAQRIDWSANTIYDYYRDDIDMLEKDQNGFLVHKFYVKNKYDQVFKCLWNNNDSKSTYEPYLLPGEFDSAYVFTGADGYKWKYIYTIDTNAKVKFMDDAWMPVPVNGKLLDPSQSTYGIGGIDVINVTDTGVLYDPTNSAITITITGDGTGSNGVPGTTASAVAQVANGEITDIVMVDRGKNYTYANVTITSSAGLGAQAFAPITPVGGHGFNLVSELGCNRVMYNIEIDKSESGAVPTDITYYQVGIINTPTSDSLSPNPANGAIYKTTTDLVVAPGYGLYTNGEKVFQGSSLDTSSFSATLLSFDSASNVLRLINIKGTPTLNAPLNAVDSKTTRTLLSVTEPDFIIGSGYITYIENRSGITRSSDGIEQFKIVLGY